MWLAICVTCVAQPAWSAIEDPGDLFGFVTADAGDLDRDGTRDFLVADPLDSDWTRTPGRVWALSGRTLAVLFEWSGAAATQLGHTLGHAGDLNGDDRPELFLGTGNLAGSATLHIVDGRTGKPVRRHEATAFDDISGFGLACTALGDVDEDGVSDYAIGAALERIPERAEDWRERSFGGQVIVISGSTGKELWRVVEPSTEWSFGAAVAAAGDFDGDATPDVLVGAPSARFAEGRVVVLSGRDGHTLRELVPDRRAEGFGYGVSGALDFDLDGKHDLVALSSFAPRCAFGFSGSTGELVRRWSVEADVHYPTRAIVVPDADGDCVGDLVLTAPASSFDESTVQLVSGRDGGTLWLLARSDYVDGNFGCSVTTIDDRNGDGCADLLIGTATYRTHEVSGRVDFCSGATGRTFDTLWRADMEGRDALTGTTHPRIQLGE